MERNMQSEWHADWGLMWDPIWMIPNIMVLDLL